MDYIALKNELLAGHPGTGAYNIDAQLAADQLNALNRTQNRDSMTGSEVLNEIDKTEFDAKTADQKQTVWDIVHLGTLNPFGVEAEMLIDVFGVGSTTIIALIVARKTSISRATELGFTLITLHNVVHARTL